MQQRDVRRAVRVVLDRGDLRRDPVLPPLEVDLAVAPLGAAAAMARGHAAVRVAAARLRQPLGERLLRLALRDRLVLQVGREATARRRRLVLLDGHYSMLCPSNSSMVSSGWRVTTAFFQRRRVPLESPRRFGLGFTQAVRTPSTRTPKISSIAWRTCVLLARSWTRNVYLLAASRA